MPTNHRGTPIAAPHMNNVLAARQQAALMHVRRSLAAGQAVSRDAMDRAGNPTMHEIEGSPVTSHRSERAQILNESGVGRSAEDWDDYYGQ